jgi:glycosyltransferase involved in cell wall biosynthesis
MASDEGWGRDLDMSHPILSVIIPAFNVESFIAAAIRSVQQQTFRDLEIIVINDGSTDSTRQVLDSFVDDPRVLIIHQDNLGTSGCRNSGLRVARGEYIGFLDGDDLWMPEHARKHVEVLSGNRGVDMTGSWWRVIYENGLDTGRCGKPKKKRIEIEDLIRENILSGTSNVVIKREAIDKAGWFDPALKATVDFDLFIRIAQLRPSNIYCIPEILTEYRLRQGQITKDWRRMASNWELVIEKVRSKCPQTVCKVENEARARFLRFLAYLAYEAGDFPSCRRLLVEAFSKGAYYICSDHRTWLTTFAASFTFLPTGAHYFIANTVKKVRSTISRHRAIKCL